MSRSSTRHVRFARSTDSIRPLRDDERSVIETFKRHTSRCRRCSNVPCARAHAYARDMANYIYLDAGRPYSVIDQRADFGHIQLDILPSLLEAIQRGLGIAQASSTLGKQTSYKAEKGPSQWMDEMEKNKEKLGRGTGERTRCEGPKTRHRQVDYSKSPVNRSIQYSGGEDDIIWIRVPLKRSELRGLIC
jgi:hypothetical protein